MQRCIFQPIAVHDSTDYVDAVVIQVFERIVWVACEID
jgi:hypothetical protein